MLMVLNQELREALAHKWRQMEACVFKLKNLGKAWKEKKREVMRFGEENRLFLKAY